jgi:hypothetical protein
LTLPFTNIRPWTWINISDNSCSHSLFVNKQRAALFCCRGYCSVYLLFTEGK